MTSTDSTPIENAQEMGFVYILRFVRADGAKLGGHASLYTGWARNVEARLHHHRNGRGARITAAAVEQGFSLELVVVIPNMTRTDERNIKNRKNAAAVVAKYTALGYGVQ